MKQEKSPGGGFIPWGGLTKINLDPHAFDCPSGLLSKKSGGGEGVFCDREVLPLLYSSCEEYHFLRRRTVLLSCCGESGFWRTALSCLLRRVKIFVRRMTANVVSCCGGWRLVIFSATADLVSCCGGWRLVIFPRRRTLFLAATVCVFLIGESKCSRRRTAVLQTPYFLVCAAVGESSVAVESENDGN